MVFLESLRTATYSTGFVLSQWEGEEAATPTPTVSDAMKAAYYEKALQMALDGMVETIKQRELEQRIGSVDIFQDKG